ncbi:hypothetical protein Vi05172_g11157 [Venturia inaequalis]|nr:hypothetical protein Vi05172_g11157 [Venturia inaequalis]
MVLHEFNVLLLGDMLDVLLYKKKEKSFCLHGCYQNDMLYEEKNCYQIPGGEGVYRQSQERNRVGRTNAAKNDTGCKKRYRQQ